MAEENAQMVDAGGGDAKPGSGTIQDDVNLDDKKPAEGDVKPEGDPKPEEAVMELDGEKYTKAEVIEAFKTHKNQSDFTAKNQAEAERLNVLQGVLEKARQGLSNPSVSTPAGSQPPQEGAGIKSSEQFRDALLGDNPGEAMALLATFIQDTVGKQTSQNQAENAFVTAHPDFKKVIASPEFQTFKATSPLGQYLNDVNGYYEFKSSTTGKALTEAEAKGLKDGELKAQAHARAKGNLKIINGGGGVSIPAGKQITPTSSRGDIEKAAINFIMSKRANE